MHVSMMPTGQSARPAGQTALRLSRSLIVFCAIFALASPARASEVRVKSQHEKASLEAVGVEGYKILAGGTLRSGVIGPGTVRITVRRLGETRQPPIAVTIIRDGRNLAHVNVGGRLRDALTDQTDRAGAPLDTVIDIPPGPHTLFVEVDAGSGAVLVTFGEERPSVPPVASARPDVTPVASPVQPAVTPQPAPAKPPAPAPTTAATPTGPGASHDERAESQPPAPDAQPVPARLETPSVAAAPPPKIAQAGRGAVRFLVGARAGVAGQTQVAATGPALGLSFRWAAWTDPGKGGTRGLLVGLSADAFRYSIGFKVGETSALPELTTTVTVTTVPVLVEGTWSLGERLGLRISPYVGIDAGVALGAIKAESLAGNVNRSLGRPAFGAHAGIEVPVGRDRVGVEVRWLWASTGSVGPARDLQVGGLLAQALWRFGL